MSEVMALERTIVEYIKEKKYSKDERRISTEIEKNEDKTSLVLNDHMPHELMFLHKGLQVGVEDEFTFEKPFWYDDAKFKRGQKFANEYYGAVNYAEMISLLIIYTFKGSLNPLIFTRRSDNPFSAGKRYLSTALRVLSWYEEDVWDKNSTAYKNIQTVRAYHSITEKCMSSKSKEELEFKTNLKKLIEPSKVMCQSLALLKEDFKGSCPFWVEECGYSKLVITQGHMSLTLFCFVGLIILYPEKLGMSDATQEDMEGFLHLWRVIGYLLGTKDEFNLCQGSFSEVKLRCEKIISDLFIPNLPNISDEWEHMSRCMIDGIAMTIPGPTFEVSSLHLFWMTGVTSDNYKRKLKWKYLIKSFINRYLLRFIMSVGFLRVRFNAFVKRQMRSKALSLFDLRIGYPQDLNSMIE